MNYNITYEADYARVIPAVLIDARAQYPQLSGATGFAMLPYINSQVALASSGSVFYKLETDSGNIVGYFTVKTIDGSLGIFALRPQFSGFSAQISQQITNFISSGNWRFDYI